VGIPLTVRRDSPALIMTRSVDWKSDGLDAGSKMDVLDSLSSGTGRTERDQ
jgi:hypothetical protein